MVKISIAKMRKKSLIITLTTISLLIIITLLMRFNEIKIFSYINSFEFSNDQFLLNTAILNYERNFAQKPNNFHEFKDLFINNISNDSPYQISDQFSYYNYTFCLSDTSFLIILSTDSINDFQHLQRASDLRWYDIYKPWNGIIVSILPRNSFRCRDFRQVTLVKKKSPILNKNTTFELEKKLKQYSLHLIKEKHIQSSKFIFLKANPLSGNFHIKIICDEQNFIYNNKDIFKDLKIILNSIPELSEFDEVYFPLFLYPEIAPNNIK
jgi:hypothetical protein